MKYTGERMVPWDRRCGNEIVACHAARYAFALPFVYGKSVIDLGCGAGYGSFMLSWAAKVVMGLDVSEEAVEFASQRYIADNLYFFTKDITDLDVTADVYVAFEVLEHLDHPEQVIRRCKSHSAPLVWSIPVNDGSKFHKRAYSVAEIDAMTGGAGWCQSQEGIIAPRDHVWFAPRYMLGVVK